jgi:ubiquitin-activating enzyme E1
MFEKIIKTNDEPKLDLNLNLIENILKFLDFSLPPFCSYIGGIAAQEVIKFTGLYRPLNQWYHYDVNDLVKVKENFCCYGDEKDKIFEDQIKIVGFDLYKFMINSN